MIFIINIILVSLCILDCSGTHSLNQVYLEFRDLPASAS